MLFLFVPDLSGTWNSIREKWLQGKHRRINLTLQTISFKRIYKNFCTSAIRLCVPRKYCCSIFLNDLWLFFCSEIKWSFKYVNGAFFYRYLSFVVRSVTPRSKRRRIPGKSNGLKRTGKLSVKNWQWTRRSSSKRGGTYLSSITENCGLKLWKRWRR